MSPASSARPPRSTLPSVAEVAPTLVTLDALRPGYDGRALLPPVSLRLVAGELWALVGRNGGGKTTLMQTLLGLQAPVSGAVAHKDGLRMAYVPQRLRYDLSVPTRVTDFVADGLETGWRFLNPFRSAQQRASVAEALRDTDLEAIALAPLSALSEGQKQRVVIARALVTQPHLMVLDEPTSAMDPVNERQILGLIAGLSQQRAIAVMIASHHMRALPDFAQHALLVDKDLGIARAGGLREVFQSAEFRRIYGDPPLGAQSEAQRA